MLNAKNILSEISPEISTFTFSAISSSRFSLLWKTPDHECRSRPFRVFWPRVQFPCIVTHCRQFNAHHSLPPELLGNLIKLHPEMGLGRIRIYSLKDYSINWAESTWYLKCTARPILPRYCNCVEQSKNVETSSHCI